MKKIIFLFLLLVPYFLFSQINEDAKRDNVWVLGYDYWYSNSPGVDVMYFSFENDSFNLIYDSLETKELSIRFTNSSICDKEGNLLFYTNGCQIADANHNIIPGAEVINGGDWIWDNNCPINGYTNPQSIIILPKPSSENVYWVLHQRQQLEWGQTVTADVSNLMLTEIEHDTLANEFDANFVDSSLIADTLFAGHLAACRHGNGRDWWIIQPELNTSGYYNFLVSPSGVELVKHQYIGDTLVHLESSTGGGMFSPDGTKYASFSRYSDIQIFDFDRCVGDFSNLVHIEIPDEPDWASGVAFSPNSRFLYLSYFTKIYQIDMHANDIPSSLLLVAEWEELGTPGLACYFNKAQLAPDGNIYIGAPGGRTCYHSIQEPDSFGVACNFVQDHELPTGINGALPYYPDFRLGEWVDSPCDTIGLVSIEEPEINEKRFMIYPNPAGDYFEIKQLSPTLKIYNWQLHDQLGQVVDTGQVKDYTTRINSTKLASGIYYLSVLSNKGEQLYFEKIAIINR